MRERDRPRRPGAPCRRRRCRLCRPAGPWGLPSCSPAGGLPGKTWEGAGGTAWGPHFRIHALPSSQDPASSALTSSLLLSPLGRLLFMQAPTLALHLPGPISRGFSKCQPIRRQGQRIKASISYPRPWRWSSWCQVLADARGAGGEGKEAGLLHTLACRTGPTRASAEPSQLAAWVTPAVDLFRNKQLQSPELQGRLGGNQEAWL